MAQIKKEFEDANLTHARELAEVREKANEDEFLSAIVRLTVVSY